MPQAFNNFTYPGVVMFEDYWCGVYFVICALLSVSGNLATIGIILIRKSLRTVSNCLIGHLAFVDFIIGGPIVITNAIRYKYN